jgi:hypothetical protein
MTLVAHHTHSPPVATQPQYQYCLTTRFENGYTMYSMCGGDSISTEMVYFTTVGATTAWPGLPRLTGSRGPAPATSTSLDSSVSTSASTGIVSSADGAKGEGTNPAIIAGSVVGGVVLGAVLATLIMLVTWKWRRRDPETYPPVVLPNPQELTGSPIPSPTSYVMHPWPNPELDAHVGNIK